MVVKVSKPEINVREKISELDKPSGIAGQAMLAAETPREQFNLISAGRRNLVINGKCSVNQRGTNTGNNTVIGPDRFFIHSGGATGHVIESSSQKDGPSGFDNCFQYKTTTAVSSSAADMYTGFAHRFEVQDAIPYIWSGASYVTASFWVKSSIAGTFTFNINPEEATGGGSANRVLYESTYVINSTNTWEYKTITIPMSYLYNFALLSNHSDIDTGLELTWVMDIISGGNRTNITAGWNQPASEARNLVTSTGGNTGFLTTAGATFKITGIQFEVGSTATPFEHRSYGEELALCERYYERLSETNTTETLIGLGMMWGSTRCLINLKFNTEKRTNPTVSFSSSTSNHVEILNNNGWRGGTSLTGIAHQKGTRIDMTGISGATGDQTSGIVAEVRLNPGIVNPYIEFDAEL